MLRNRSKPLYYSIVLNLIILLLHHSCCFGWSSSTNHRHTNHQDQCHPKIINNEVVPPMGQSGTINSDFPNIEELSNRVMSRSCFVTSVASALFVTTSNPSLASANNPAAQPEKEQQQPPSSSSSSSSLQESVSGFIAGAALGATKTIVKFPLDTATVRLQMPKSDYSIRDPIRLLNGSYNGITLSLLSNIPAGAIFFAFKDATKASLKSSAWSILSDSPKWLTTTIAVAAAQIPYWLVRNPSEVIKVRQQAGIEGYGEGVSALNAVQKTFRDSNNNNNNNNNSTMNGIQEFYTGYWENIVYAYPADVIKFVAYEALTNGRKDLSPLEGAEAGALATACAQFVTTPLDVIRNRLMTGKDKDGATLSKDELKEGYFETLVRLAREEGASGLFAGASPRVGKAILSGAIQFATYEETKQSIKRFLSK